MRIPLTYDLLFFVALSTYYFQYKFGKTKNLPIKDKILCIMTAVCLAVSLLCTVILFIYIKLYE